MAKALGGSFTITALADGATYQGTIHSDKPMTQFYNKSTNTATPSWEGGTTDAPSFYLTIRDQDGNIVPYNEDTVEIYYGGMCIWQNGAQQNGSYVNKQGNAQMGNVTMPRYQFIKDLASSTNMDDDVIYMVAKINIGGTYVPIESSTKTIQIRATEGGSAHILTVVVKDIHKQGELGELTAIVTDQQGIAVTNITNYEWYDLTGDTSEPIATGASKKTIQLNSDDVDGYDVYRCVVTLDDGTKVIGAGGIRDYSDPYYADWELQPAVSIIRPNQVIKATPHLYDDNGGKLEVGNHNISAINLQATFLKSDGTDATGLTANADGSYDITFSLVESNGMTIKGYVTAEVTLGGGI